MDPLAFLHARRSTPSRLLGEPAPDDAQLLRLLEAAVRVPDHGKLVPFRFLRLRGDARAPDREKGERRRWIGERPRVVLMLGDNLGDFVDGINTDRAGREALVDAHAARWGTQWIMLPNPAYGPWEAALMRGCATSDDATRCKRDGLRTE